ncbi:MAG: hypothetical protein AAGJ40_11225 [Planctomycetota bacterium]
MTVIRVIKLGGSLLGRATLLDDFHHWLRESVGGDDRIISVVIVGGGDMINAVRVWDRCRPIDPSEVHWNCVEMLRWSFAHLKASMRLDARFSDFGYVTERDHFAEWFDLIRGPTMPKNRRWLVNVPAAYDLGIETPLPQNWSTTTDAIAWWIASSLSAFECVLLKSCAVPESHTVTDWIEQGIVDSACAELLDCGVPLRIHQL